MATLPRPRRADSSVQSVGRSLAVLEELALARGPMRLIDLSAKLGLHKSTVFRLLATLEAYGYVEQDPETGRYGVGVRLLEVGGAALEKTPLLTASRSALETLMRETGETVNLGVLQGAEVLILEKVESENSIRMSIPVGRRSPAYCTAIGKVLLAHDPQACSGLLGAASLPRYTPNTITQPDLLREHLARVADLGYGLDEEEQMPGARCIAAPVRNHTGRVLAAVSVSGTTVRISPERLTELIPLVQAAARSISARLGHRSA